MDYDNKKEKEIERERNIPELPTDHFPLPRIGAFFSVQVLRPMESEGLSEPAG